MTSKERISNILRHKPVDRIGLHEHFWADTRESLIQGGFVTAEESLEDHFDLDIQECWPFNFTADLDFVPQIIKEDEETQTVLDGNGAYLRRHKLHDSTPEHVNYIVRTREEWEKRKPLLVNVDERRINFEAYRNARRHCLERDKFFVWSGVNVFESMHPICGHENLLIGMIDDPEWVLDMADTYCNLTIKLQEILFEKEGKPDGIWYYEDLGYKESPFMSPNMYRELIKPFHVKAHAYAHSLGLPVIMHSCGFVEPLLADIVDSGIDCLQVIEIKAGMDLLRIYKEYGQKIALMGGIDVRALYSNDKSVIDKELESKIPIVKDGHFVLHSDHSIPKTVNYDIFKYYIEKGLSLGNYI